MFDKSMEQFYPDERKVEKIGVCYECDHHIYEDEEYYKKEDWNIYFCCLECVLKYYDIKEVK